MFLLGKHGHTISVYSPTASFYQCVMCNGYRIKHCFSISTIAHGRWFSPGTPASSTTKTGHHDIAEILLKVALNTINQKSNLLALNVR